jgi:hypothetical protein
MEVRHEGQVLRPSRLIGEVGDTEGEDRAILQKSLEKPPYRKDVAMLAMLAMLLLKRV